MKIKLENMIAWMLIESYKSGKYSISVDDLRILAKRLENKSKESGMNLKVIFSKDELQAVLKKHEREFIESFGEITAYMGVGCLYKYVNSLDYNTKKLLEECIEK